MAEPFEIPGPLPGPVSIGEFRARLAEMTDRVLAGEEVVVLRGTRPVARFVPVEPRVPKRLGTLNDLLSDEELRDLDEAVASPWSDIDRAILAGEATDDLGLWKGRSQADGA